MPVTDLLSQLKRDEGLRLAPYRDQAGKLTIGYGRNLDDDGITLAEAESMLADDMLRVCGDLAKVMPWTNKLDDARLGVLQNMAYEMGIKGLLEFGNMLGALNQGNYVQASEEMMKSKWAQEVPDRAGRLRKQMLLGIWQ